MSAIHCLNSLTDKSAAAAEVPKIQLSGCVLVAVLEQVELLEAKEILDNLHDLMKVLKLPCTDPAFVKDWWRNFQDCYATNK